VSSADLDDRTVLSNMIEHGNRGDYVLVKATNPLWISTGFLKYPLELKKNFS
jgi:hypothetical protein